MDNIKHQVGILIGLTILKATGLRFNKAQRGSHWYSTVAANLAAEGIVVWAPYK